jgi:hypothetical protein
MARLTASVLVAIAIVSSHITVAQSRTSPAIAVSAQRFAQNPLVTLNSSATLGDNIDGPTVIRVPAWVNRPLGRYYMYFAHHMGHFIRIAYADAVTGPWTVYEPGVLPVADTAFFRPQPDPPENLENFYTHVASPEIYIDNDHRRLIVWFHGWFTDGKPFPVGDRAARQFAQQNGYTQSTQVAESTDGLHFTTRPVITKTSYLRVLPWNGAFYAMARLGLLLRSTDPFGVFEPGPNPFRDTPFAGRVRHVGFTRRAQTLYTFFSAIGDAPERIMMTTIDLSGDWSTWKTSPAIEILQPQAAYECPTLPNVPSEAGDIKGPARQLRDPAVFEDDGRTFLFYSICGEQGIAGAELTLPQ